MAQQIAAKIADYGTRSTSSWLGRSSDIQTLNHNVIETGQLLSGYVGACRAANAARRQLRRPRGERCGRPSRRSEGHDRDAQTQLSDQRAAVDTAVENYQTAIRGMERDAIVDMSFDIAKVVFELGAGLAEGIRCCSLLL